MTVEELIRELHLKNPKLQVVIHIPRDKTPTSVYTSYINPKGWVKRDHPIVVVS